MSFIGRKISGYVVKKEIGRGGMGVVLLAENQILKTQVAIKVLDRKFSQDTELRKRFKREAVVQNRLVHPQLVKLINYIEEDDDSFILMEYFKSRPLSTMIGKETGPIPFEDAFPIFKQILEGIGYAHKKKIIHRDIKPSNILINKNNEIKVSDFGIAKPTEDEGEMKITKAGALIGTPYYMAPEQIKGLSADHRSDIYSLGVTLYETLAGRLPFLHTSDFDIRSAQVHEIPADPRDFYPHIPENIVKIVLKMLSKDPKKRQKSCKEIIDQFGKYVKVETEKPKQKNKKADDSPFSTKASKTKVESIQEPTKKFTEKKYQKLISQSNKDESSSNKDKSPPPRKPMPIYTKVAVTTIIGFFIFIYLSNQPKLTLKSPDDSQVWKIGQTRSITWESKNLPNDDRINIDLLKNDDIVQPIAKRTENDGNHTWTIGRGLSESDKYDILITSLRKDVYDRMDGWLSIKKGTKKSTYSKTSEDYFYEGYDHYIDKKYDKAITSFSKSIEIDMTHSIAYHYRGYSYLSLNNYGDAKSDFDRCIALDDNKFKGHCYNGRGMIDFNVNKNYESAIGEFHQAVKYNPDIGQYYYNRALAYQELNNKIKACDDFRDASKLDHSKAKQSLINYCK